MNKEQITELFDKQGNLIGALLTADAWLELKPHVFTEAAAEPAEPETPEPLGDWETFKSFWDFGYPVDMDVTCGTCGTHTDDWSADTPRRFRLTAASLSGLVTFKCLACESKIMKKHFKDELVVETHPKQTKDQRKEALY